MDRTERFYRMLKLLESRRVVSRDAFMDDMSVSRATFKRDLEYMVERLRAPILYDRSLVAIDSTTLRAPRVSSSRRLVQRE